MQCNTVENETLPTPVVLEIMPERVLQLMAIEQLGFEQFTPRRNMKHSHYFKDVSYLQTVDVYRILQLFNVTDPCVQHAVKKLLVAGGRGAGKDITKDIQEAIDSLKRWQDMRAEEQPKDLGFAPARAIPVPSAAVFKTNGLEA